MVSSTARSRFAGAACRVPAHAGTIGDPEIDGLRRLPFRLAHEEPVGAGALSPIDALGGIALGEGSVLPETVAAAGAPPPMHALRHCGGNPFGRHQQRRQRAPECLRGQCGIVGSRLSLVDR